MPLNALGRIAGVLLVGLSVGAVAEAAQQSGDGHSELPNVVKPLQPGMPLEVTVPAPSEPRLRSS